MFTGLHSECLTMMSPTPIKGQQNQLTMQTISGYRCDKTRASRPALFPITGYRNASATNHSIRVIGAGCADARRLT
jgi:hypothetical protein